MNAARHATTRWLSNPPSGAGRLYSESKAFQGLPFSVPEGEAKLEETTPGELLAAAYSTFLATYLAQALDAADVRARELVVDVWCRLSPPERPPRAVERVEVDVHGRVEDIENSGFEDAVGTTWETCRRSLGLREDIHITLHAALV
jgi:organic hydroperoxide reductase OsmC/OhrA